MREGIELNWFMITAKSWDLDKDEGHRSLSSSYPTRPPLPMEGPIHEIDIKTQFLNANFITSIENKSTSSKSHGLEGCREWQTVWHVYWIDKTDNISNTSLEEQSRASYARTTM
jgi:hypothetical protein